MFYPGSWSKCESKRHLQYELSSQSPIASSVFTISALYRSPHAPVPSCAASWMQRWRGLSSNGPCTWRADPIGASRKLQLGRPTAAAPLPNVSRLFRPKSWGWSRKLGHPRLTTRQFVSSILQCIGGRSVNVRTLHRLLRTMIIRILSESSPFSKCIVSECFFPKVTSFSNDHTHKTSSQKIQLKSSDQIGWAADHLRDLHELRTLAATLALLPSAQQKQKAQETTGEIGRTNNLNNQHVLFNAKIGKLENVKKKLAEGWKKPSPKSQFCSKERFRTVSGRPRQPGGMRGHRSGGIGRRALSFLKRCSYHGTGVKLISCEVVIWNLPNFSRKWYKTKRTMRLAARVHEQSPLALDPSSVSPSLMTGGWRLNMFSNAHLGFSDTCGVVVGNTWASTWTLWKGPFVVPHTNISTFGSSWS